MILARLGLAAAVCTLAASASLAGEPAPDHDQAISQMRAWTHLPAHAIIAVTPEMAVALLGRGAPAKAGHVEGVELQGEVLDDAFAEGRGWRSMRLKLDIACQGGGTWVRKMTVYPQHDHGGAGREAITPIGWVRPKPEAYLGQVVIAICGPADDPAPSTRPAPSLRPAILATAQSEVTPPPVTLRPVTSPPESPPPATGGAAASGASAVVQIAAAPSEADARKTLAGPAAQRMATTPGLAFRVDPAMVAGRQVYRAVVAGFADRGAAKSWCLALRQAGGACFVR